MERAECSHYQRLSVNADPIAVHMTGYSLKVQYDKTLDYWIESAVGTGVDNLWDMVEALPGVDPFTTRKAVKRLITESRIPAHVIDESQSAFEERQADLAVPGLPLPHPLAFDWRFTTTTANRLLERSSESTSPGETIALLGTPSLYMLSYQMETRRRCYLVDQNQSLAISVPASTTRGEFHCDDVFRSHPSLPPAQLVIADPPWYEYEVIAFLESSAQICANLGMVYVSFPPVGVRPGIKQERARVVAAAQKAGLRLVGHEPLVLSYATPFFEYNALLADGFTKVCPNWRRGDLLLFQSQGTTRTNIGNPAVNGDSWADIDIFGIRVWIREESFDGFEDPRLTSIVEGDILPTVSMRDSRRESANVWTTGNRIYHCKGPEVLSTILQALRAEENPATALQIKLQRPLSILESQAVSSSVDQIKELARREGQEISKFQNG